MKPKLSRYETDYDKFEPIEREKVEVSHLPTLPCSQCSRLVPVPIGFYLMITHRHGDKASVICCGRLIDIVAYKEPDERNSIVGSKQVSGERLEYQKNYKRKKRLEAKVGTSIKRKNIKNV